MPGSFTSDWTFNDIVDEVLALRFSEGQRTQAQFWVMQGYKKVWYAADWPWKFAQYAGVVTASNPVLTMSVFGDTPDETPAIIRICNVWDDEGERLRYLRPDEWNEIYLPGFVDSSTGTPEAWTDQAPTTTTQTTTQSGGYPWVILGPTPESNATFTVRVEKRPTPFDSDDGRPDLPDEWLYALLYAAMSIGLRLENDPTWEPVEQMFHEEITSLMNASFPQTLSENRSYGGKDNFLYGW